MKPYSLEYQGTVQRLLALRGGAFLGEGGGILTNAELASLTGDVQARMTPNEFVTHLLHMRRGRELAEQRIENDRYAEVLSEAHAADERVVKESAA